jgi:hypothetical protein
VTASPAKPDEPLRVLLVEDSEADAMLLELELRGQGFDLLMERAATEAALRNALDRPWDVVLADYRVPGFSGLGALALVKERAPDLPVIVVSGSVGDEALVAAMRAGASDYVLKDNLSRLAAAIRRELRDAEASRQRREAERVRRETEERFRFVVERTGEVLYRLRFDTMTYDYLSPGIEKLVGYEPEEINAMGFARLVTAVEPSTPAAHPRELLRMALETGRAGEFWGNYEVRTKSGELRWLADHSFPWQDDEGRLKGSVGVLSDITERRRREAALREAQQRLQTDVTEKRSLEAQLLQSQKMESMGRLAGGVAHDFNNLLAVISGYGELLRRRVGADAQLRRYADDILKATERAAGLTGQLLAFSRKQVLQLRILNLNVVVEETEKMLRRLIGEDVQLSTVFDDRLDPVQADFGQMQQVLMNLALNARDAMPRGGRLTIETGNLVLDETNARQHAGVEPGRFVVLAVRDTGHGMSADTLRHIFEPFFTTKAPGKGTGPGLATVHGIVKQSGGHIGVQSEPGHGTTFKIYLRRADSSAEEAPPAPAATDLSRGSETVLLVEDEASVRELMRECLAALGYTVLEASGGAAALELSQAHGAPIHLLVTDMVMPDMGGRELAERLLASRPEARVLYISGYTDMGHGALTEDMAFLQKPFTIEGLSRKVREVLDRINPAPPPARPPRG